MDNTVTIIGNLTADPDMKFTNGGSCLVNFTVAVNKRRKVGDNYENESHFFDCTAFAELAEHINGSCTKGTRVIVVGTLTQDRWEAPDGSKRSRVKVMCDDCGPSVRWATAEVVKAERSERSVSGQSQQPTADDFDYSKPW